MSDIEIKNGTTIPTYFLMKQLKEQYGHESEFHFIIGSDLIPTLRSWHEGPKLLEEVNFIIYNRVGYPLDLTSPEIPIHNLYKPDSKNIFGEISSTEVRNRIVDLRHRECRDYFDISGLVTKNVISYIRDNSLY